jgi:hypothetical protein
VNEIVFRPRAGSCKAKERSMRVGILGSWLMGGKLGTILARAGDEVWHPNPSPIHSVPDQRRMR